MNHSYMTQAREPRSLRESQTAPTTMSNFSANFSDLSPVSPSARDGKAAETACLRVLSGVTTTSVHTQHLCINMHRRSMYECPIDEYRARSGLCHLGSIRRQGFAHSKGGLAVDPQRVFH
jgi:hypothetical protein